MSGSLLIRGASIVSSEGIQKSDIYIEEGCIVEVGDRLSCSAQRTIDAHGLHVFYGVMDPQVHFRESGYESLEERNQLAETIFSGSCSAVKGGVTSFLDMPNTRPVAVTMEAIEQKHRVASQTSLAHYGFFLGASQGYLDELEKKGVVCGIKVFMGSSTGDLLVDDIETLEAVFKRGRRLIAVHAEDNQILTEAKKKYENSYSFDDHRYARPASAALKATQLACRLADKYQRRLHILHMTTKDEVLFLRDYKRSFISAEVCPQHLLCYAPDVYLRQGGYAQMNPPIRDVSHMNELRSGLLDGVIHCIASDHAPHHRDKKSAPYGRVPSGMPGVELIFPLMLDASYRGLFRVEQVAQWMCEMPYSLYGVLGKGWVRPGYDADLVFVDLNKSFRVDDFKVQTQCQWSLFHGESLYGCPEMTIVKGRVVCDSGDIDTSVRGEALRFLGEE